MNNFTSQSTRQGSRLQTAPKAGLGNGGNAGWNSFNAPSAGAFGGQTRAPGLSGFAQVMGGGPGQGPIDLSDFPSLSGGSRQQNAATAAGWNSSAIRQPSSQHIQQRAPSAAPSQQSLDPFEGQRLSQATADRAGSGDEFPPLGSHVSGDATGQPNGFGGSMASPDIQQPRSITQPTQTPIRDVNLGFQQGQPTPIGQPPAQSAQQAAPTGQTAPPAGLKKYADMTEAEKWGLPGLLAAFEARKQAEIGGQVDETVPVSMRNPILMGHDLTQLGLDLDSPEPLYPTFTPFPNITSLTSQFDFHDRHTIPDFQLPSAYTVTNVPELKTRMSAFADETLFSIFYQNPGDITQELAAVELQGRDWRWHKVLRQWLQKDTREAQTNSSLTLIDMAGTQPVGAPPNRINDRTESGVYVFFDAMNWRRERRQFVLDYDQLDQRPGGPVAGGIGIGMGAQMAMQPGGGQQSGIGSSQIPSA